MLVGDERIWQLVDDVFEQSIGPLEYKLYFDHFGWSVKLQLFETKDEEVESESEIVKDIPWKFGNVRQDPILPIRLMFMFRSNMFERTLILIHPNWFWFLFKYLSDLSVGWLSAWLNETLSGEDRAWWICVSFLYKRWEKRHRQNCCTLSISQLDNVTGTNLWKRPSPCCWRRQPHLQLPFQQERSVCWCREWVNWSLKDRKTG